MMKKSLVLQKIDAKANAFKYYRLTLLDSGSGPWHLRHEWGRIGKAPRELVESFEDHQKAEKAFNRLKQQKLKRGYQPLPGEELPEHYQLESCPWCAQAVTGQLLTALDQGGAQFVYPDHVPLWGMDAASQVQWLAELRKLAKDENVELFFPTGDHARAVLIGKRLADEMPTIESGFKASRRAAPSIQLNWLDLVS